MDDRRPDEPPFPPAHDPDPSDAYGDGGPLPPPPRPEIGGLPPWEDRRHHGVLGGFFTTVAQVMTAPGRFFRDHPVDHGWLGPVSFAVVMGVLAACVSWLWSTVFSGMELGVISLLEQMNAEAATDAALMQTIQSLSVILSPLTTLIGLFLYAGVFHLGVMLLSPDGRGFEATLRAVAYGNAAYVLALIPMCGGPLVNLWSLVLTVIGLDKLHGCGLGRASIIVIGPLMLFVCGCGALIGLTGLLAS